MYSKELGFLLKQSYNSLSKFTIHIFFNCKLLQNSNIFTERLIIMLKNMMRSIPHEKELRIFTSELTENQSKFLIQFRVTKSLYSNDRQRGFLNRSISNRAVG